MPSRPRSSPPAVTMADVARHAKVSRATVSRVLSGQQEVAEPTRTRVLSAINSLGYVPAIAAQQLAAGRSRTVGLLIREPRNATYGLLHSEVQRWAHEFGFEIVTVTPTFYRGGDDEMAALRRLVGMRVGGLLVATGVVQTADIRQFVPVVPVVSVGRPESDPAIFGVSYDEESNATQLARAVYDHGHRKVAVVVPRPEMSRAENLRGATAAKVLTDLGVAVEVIDAKLFAVAGEGDDRIVDLVRSNRVTAAIFTTDQRMVRFVNYARGQGMEVPRDLSVIGCDGVMEGLAYMELATLRVPVETVARRASEVIASLLDDSAPAVTHERHAGELVPARSLARVTS